MSTFDPLVTTQWLADHIGEKDVKILDGSWRMPGEGFGIDAYRERHIPGAQFFDLDKVAEPDTGLPHMLPPVTLFENAVGGLGITQSDTVIAYDDQGLFSAARVWWTFRAMGHEKIAVLNGGLPKWQDENRPIENAVAAPTAAPYRASPKTELVMAAQDLSSAVRSGSHTILDARPAARFEGKAPEPRAGLRSGHMPGASNIPFGALLTDSGELRSREELRSIFAGAGVSENLPVVTSCGSGVTAAILSLGLEVAGIERHALYDGSWAEWGNEENDDADFPVRQ